MDSRVGTLLRVAVLTGPVVVLTLFALREGAPRHWLFVIGPLLLGLLYLAIRGFRALRGRASDGAFAAALAGAAGKRRANAQSPAARACSRIAS